MELPTCPACGQSVLDDDASDCPFCGSPMSGAPAKRQAASRPVTTPKPAAKKAEETPQSKAVAAPAAKKTDDEDPFAADQAAGGAAVRLRGKPAKGSNFKVVCPMCETAGYVSPKAAGKEVRCANPECLVPVFTAPELPKKPAPVEAPPPPKSRAMEWLIISVVSVVAIAVGVWYVTYEPAAPGPQLGVGTTPSHGLSRELDEPPAGTSSAENGTPGETDTEQSSPPEPQVMLADLRRRTLPLMVEIARDAPQDDKAYCRRLTAEAYADAGDLDAARGQLEQLQKVGAAIPYYRIPPLATIAWQELAAGRPDAARAAAEDALAAARNMPIVGRDPLESALALAAVLVAVGRQQDAIDLLDAQKQQSKPASLSVMQLLSVRAFRSYDLDAAVRAEPVQPLTAPHWATVTLLVSARGLWDEALRWAERHPELAGRTECVVAWADAFAAYADGSLREIEAQRLDAAAAKLPPAGRALLFARVAGRQHARGDQEQAEASLAKAQSAFDALPAPQAMRLPGLKELYGLSLPDPVPLRLAALAAAELAGVEARLGRTEAAAGSLQRSLGFARALAPTLPAIQQRLDEVNNQPGQLREQLKAVFELRTDDEAQRRFNSYGSRVRAMHEAARSRFDLQTAVLAHTAGRGLRREVWTEVRTRSAESDLNDREPFLTTVVPWLLGEQARAVGDGELAQEVQSALMGTKQPNDPRLSLEPETARQVADGKIEPAADRIAKATSDADWRTRWVMQLACRLVADGRIDDAMQFVRAFKSGNDAPLRQDVCEMIAAQATRRGDGRAVWQIIDNTPFPPKERIAVCRGFVAGVESLAAE